MNAGGSGVHWWDLEVLPELRNNSAWKVMDPDWVRAREEQWREVFPRLEPLRLQAAEIRTLRDYFLTGHGRTQSWEELPLHAIFLLFRIWWHPDRSVENWATQIRYTTWGDYQASVRYLGRICASDTMGLGGQERELFEVFYGEPVIRPFLEISSAGERAWPTRSIVEVFWHPESMAFSLAGVFGFALANVRCASRVKIRRSLALWKDIAWDRALPPAKGSRNFVQLFEYILTGSYRSKLKKPTEEQLRERVELAAELRVLFDEGIGPPEFQAFWEQQKAAILARAASGGGAGKSAKAKPASVATKKKAATKPVSETPTKAKTGAAKKVGTKKAPAKKKATRK